MKILVALVFLFAIGCSKRPADIVNHNTTQVVNECSTTWFFYGITDTIESKTTLVAIDGRMKISAPVGHIEFRSIHDYGFKIDTSWIAEAFDSYFISDSVFVAGKNDPPFRDSAFFRIPFLVVR